MCSLLGYSFKQGTISSARRAVLATNLAQFGDMRGGHSWGLVGIKKDDARIVRGLGELANHAYEMCDYLTLFGHTRWATTGEITTENAHPFKIGNILGAHNGMLYNHDALNVQYKRDFKVDSQHIFAHLNEKRPFDDLIGYGAIEWMYLDDSLKRIYLSRLREGELSIVGIGKNAKNLDGIAWASSHKHLMMALYRAGIENIIRFKVPVGKVFFVHRGRLMSEPNMKLFLGKVPEAEVDKLANKTAQYKEYKDIVGSMRLHHNNFRN